MINARPVEWLIRATPAFYFLLGAFAFGEEKLVVHEWAVFTAFQDESGKEISGINLEDVPVPEKLHKIAPGPILPVIRGGETGAEETRCHSQVTVRLEKAVIKFYPAADLVMPVSATVNVRSNESWLTQYYPDAQVWSPGFSRDHIWMMGHRSSLEWAIALQSSGDDPLMSADSTAGELGPRPARIDVKGEEADGLIYRGVSNNRAPLRIVRDGPGLIIASAGDPHLDLPELWLMEVRANGSTASRVLHPFNEETAFLVKTPAGFSAEETTADSLDRLNAGLRNSLRRAGLFAEETDALIKTLTAAHSHRVGLRLFFLSPTKPANRSSMLRISPERKHGRSIETTSTRVVVACIELVTPEERALLARIAAGGELQSVTGQPVKPETLSDDRWQKLSAIYEGLGQFRNALLLDEQRRRPSPILTAFITRFRLEGYTPPNEWARLIEKRSR